MLPFAHCAAYIDSKTRAYAPAQEAMAEQRPAVDDLIKVLWDTIEFNLRNEEPSSLRRRS